MSEIEWLTSLARELPHRGDNASVSFSGIVVRNAAKGSHPGSIATLVRAIHSLAPLKSATVHVDRQTDVYTLRERNRDDVVQGVAEYLSGGLNDEGEAVIAKLGGVGAVAERVVEWFAKENVDAQG